MTLRLSLGPGPCRAGVDDLINFTGVTEAAGSRAVDILGATNNNDRRGVEIF